MSARGRVTLAVFLGAAVLGFAVAWVWPLVGLRPDPAQTVPAVSAALPEERVSEVPRAILERLPVTRDVLELHATADAEGGGGPVGEDGVTGRIVERLDVGVEGVGMEGPLRVVYTLDASLTRQVFEVLKRGRVDLGHVLLLDPNTGRVLAYASTDAEAFPPTRSYPAASLVKVITAAAALDADPQMARLPCRYRGSPYRLTRSRVDPPRSGHTISLRKALATSNNQCFAQLAVHAVGGGALVDAIGRFGWLSEPAPGHAAGSANAGTDRYDVGRLGCGLAGCRITPLHAAQLAATLAHGELVAPVWIDRVLDARGRELTLPARPTPRRVLSPELTRELRTMLVDTTTRGTARSAFRYRNGRPRLGSVKVAGKTGSLSGRDPKGRYEWFVGVAPADDPRIAVAVLLVQSDLWWRSASQIAADVLERVFCVGRKCNGENSSRWLPKREHTASLDASSAPLLN